MNDISGYFYSAGLPRISKKKVINKKSHELRHQQREPFDWKKGLADDTGESEKFDQGIVSPIPQDPRYLAY